VSIIAKNGNTGNVKWAFLNASGSGDTELVAAVTGTAIRVVALHLVSTAANTVKFRSNTTDKTAGKPLAANGGLVLPLNEHGWFETAAGEKLNFNQSAATAAGVSVAYVEVR